MKNTIIILTVSFFLTSCATIVNKKSYPVNISSNIENATIEIKDTTYNLPATVKVERSKNDLAIKIKSDTTEIDFTVKSSKSPAFLFGNLIYSWGAPVGYLIDLTNQKRFYYSHSIFLDTTDTNRIIGSPRVKYLREYFTRTYPKNKGAIYLHVSFPWVNSFYLKPPKESARKNTGFIGITLGVDYWYATNKFIDAGASTVTDFLFPLPAPIDFTGEMDAMYSKYLSLSNNHKLKRFTIGYGLVYAKNTWAHRYFGGFGAPPPTREPITKSYPSFGLIFPIHYQFGKSFYSGIVYRPTFLRPDLFDKFKYEHLISVDFAWKIKLKK